MIETIVLTLALASATTLVLLCLGTPLAWWLSQTRSPVRPALEALTAMPLVLPPTVLGFYFLVLFSPTAPVGAWLLEVTGTRLTFSFEGLVLASVVYSLPFMVQPLQSSFAALGRAPLDAAATLGASPLDRFFSVVVPQCRRGFLAASVLTFAHTVGEFGVVLLVGGNLPGETRVLSIAIYEHVETLDYGTAHTLSGGLLVFSFVVLLLVYATRGKPPLVVGTQ
ncbi:MAG: molybdate ABC transporter permease subunit [Pseudomonadota bacterium]